jgi:hypothetical protein
VINSNNVSRLLASAYQISAENFEKIRSFSTVHSDHSYSYIVSVRRLVPTTVNQSLVIAVLKRLDYGNAAQAGLPSYLHRCRLSILVGRRPLHRSDLFTYSLSSFRCLRSNEQIKFKLANIVYWYRSLHGTVLGYVSSELAYIVWLTFHWQWRF